VGSQDQDNPVGPYTKVSIAHGDGQRGPVRLTLPSVDVYVVVARAVQLRESHKYIPVVWLSDAGNFTICRYRANERWAAADLMR
ncbi:MAG: hypothetical protein QGI33_07115, partial [Candidatus Brocadiia bacterium]|nr:hypothetical protein [Candidatus Brocadiia bacterium]